MSTTAESASSSTKTSLSTSRASCSHPEKPHCDKHQTRSSAHSLRSPSSLSSLTTSFQQPKSQAPRVSTLERGTSRLSGTKLVTKPASTRTRAPDPGQSQPTTTEATVNETKLPTSRPTVTLRVASLATTFLSGPTR